MMGWERGESGVKPHLPVCVCVLVFAATVYACVVIPCCISYVLPCMYVNETLQITGLLRAGCRTR